MGSSQWFYEDGFLQEPYASWGAAHNFKNSWDGYADLADYDTDLAIGDPVNADFTDDGHIDHTAVVTKIDSSGNRFVTQHTSDKKDAPLDNWFNNNYTVYGWEMETVDSQWID